METGKCILCPDSVTSLSCYCDTHFRYLNLQPTNYILGRQRTILTRIVNYLYSKYLIRAFIEFPLKVNNTTYFLDLMFEYGGKTWILEIDEHAHRSYDQEKDQRRTSAFLEFKRKVNLLRVNPDKYYDVLTDQIIPPICERAVILTRDRGSLIERKHVDLYVRPDELSRRVGIILSIIDEAFSNSYTLIGESIFNGDIIMRKVFY